MRALHLPQSRSHALPDVSRPGFLYIHRRPGGWLQSGDRDPAQAGWHALERQGRKRHHRAALLEAQRTL